MLLRPRAGVNLAGFARASVSLEIPSGFIRWSFNFDLTGGGVPQKPSGFSRWSFNFNLTGLIPG
jgi:hypothetical protein